MTNLAPPHLAPAPLTKFDQRVREIGSELNPERRKIFDKVMENVDTEQLAELQQLYADRISDNPFAGFTKYLDLPFWVADKIDRAQTLGLHTSGGRLLDLGTGAGHFLAVCTALGHECIGLDVENKISASLARALNVDRRVLPIMPQIPLPEELGQFDCVTAFAIKFDMIGTDDNGAGIYWTKEDWSYLLRDLTEDRMQLPGLIHLQLNSRLTASGKRESFSEVLSWFEAIGASVNSSRSEISLRAKESLSLD